MPTPLNRPSVELFFGKSGTGKTRLALSRIGPDRCILFDINEQQQLATNATICTEPAELLRALMKGARRICWRGFGTMGEAAFEYGNRAALAAGDLCVFWDEVDMMMDPRKGAPPFAYRLINAGRHRGVTITATARRPAAMPRSLTAAATAVYAYEVTSPKDIAYLAEFFGRDQAAALPELGRGEGLFWTETGSGRKKFYRA